MTNRNPTQGQVATELRDLNRQLDVTLARYSSSGTGLIQRARAARRMADLYAQREALVLLAASAFKVGTGRTIVEHLAAQASTADARSAHSWRVNAETLERQAVELERTTAAAFGDGLTYVPGRGRVRDTL
jgi:hypothetical protein